MFGSGCRCKALSVDMESTKLEIAIVESKHGKMIDKNSEEISQMKSKVNDIVSRLESMNNFVNHLKDPKAATDEYKESAEVIVRLRDENELLINSLNVITRELERYRTLDTGTSTIVGNRVPYCPYRLSNRSFFSQNLAPYFSRNYRWKDWLNHVHRKSKSEILE